MTPIENLRLMVKTLQEMRTEDPENDNTYMLDVPPDIKELFKQLVADPTTTAEDLVNCMCILSNADATDWDFIAHMFL